MSVHTSFLHLAFLQVFHFYHFLLFPFFIINNSGAEMTIRVNIQFSLFFFLSIVRSLLILRSHTDPYIMLLDTPTFYSFSRKADSSIDTCWEMLNTVFIHSTFFSLKALH